MNKLKKKKNQLPKTKNDPDLKIYQRLFKMGKQLLVESEVNKLLHFAMDEAIQISGAERGMIILFDNTGQIQFQSARNLNKEEIKNPEFEVSRTIINTVKKNKQPVCLQNALDTPEFKKKKSVEKLQLLSVICLPLIHEEKLFGVVYLDNRTFTGIFKPEIFCFVQEFSDLISIAAYNALERKQLQNQVSTLEEELRGKYKFESIIGHHPKMMEILKLVAKVADTSAAVLIQGESGTGKELIAQALHYNSHRKNNPFVPVNCGAIPEQLLESELFGHVRGAFTGAVQDKAGWFEVANGGTIFLDEINDMSPALQVCLLRVLQTGEYSRVGSSEIRHCDVRVVTASSRDLKKLIRKGEFREEIYYRLNVIEIVLPPLRERKSDIPLLAHHYLKQFAEKHGKKNLRISEQAESLLLNYNFPGNVRELVNIIQRAVVLIEGKIVEVHHLPETVLEGIGKDKGKGKEKDYNLSFKVSKQRALEQFEIDYIKNVLKNTGGNITRAAKISGMNVKNFHVKMKKYGINPKNLKTNNS